jgi:hypothetical protein
MSIQMTAASCLRVGNANVRFILRFLLARTSRLLSPFMLWCRGSARLAWSSGLVLHGWSQRFYWLAFVVPLVMLTACQSEIPQIGQVHPLSSQDGTYRVLARYESEGEGGGIVARNAYICDVPCVNVNTITLEENHFDTGNLVNYPVALLEDGDRNLFFIYSEFQTGVHVLVRRDSDWSEIALATELPEGARNVYPSYNRFSAWSSADGVIRIFLYNWLFEIVRHE